MKPDLHSFSYCLDYLREQLADVAAPDMVAQPKGMVNGLPPMARGFE